MGKKKKKSSEVVDHSSDGLDVGVFAPATRQGRRDLAQTRGCVYNFGLLVYHPPARGTDAAENHIVQV